MQKKLFITRKDAAMWARINKGGWRGNLWTRVLKQIDRMVKRTGGYLCIWWSSYKKRDLQFGHEHGHGLVEVRPALPAKALRKRKPRK